MKRALFPISVANPLFSSENTIAAFESGLRDYDEVTFLIADRIQVYNDIAKNEGDLPKICRLDWSGNYRQDYEQRKRWLTKLRDRLTDWPADQKWKIIGVSDAIDQKAYLALRSVWLLYRIDNRFRADIDRLAGDFAERSPLDSKSKLLHQMSVGYLMEEIAINVRLRVVRGIYEEFYIGETIDILPKLYSGYYIRRAEELIGRKPRPSGAFSFFYWSGKDWHPWNESALDKVAKRRVAVS